MVKDVRPGRHFSVFELNYTTNQQHHNVANHHNVDRALRLLSAVQFVWVVWFNIIVSQYGDTNLMSTLVQNKLFICFTYLLVDSYMIYNCVNVKTRLYTQISLQMMYSIIIIYGYYINLADLYTAAISVVGTLMMYLINRQ